MEIIKETSHMGTLLIKEIDYQQAKEMIIKNHYSHKWNGYFGKVNVGIFKKEDPYNCLGVAVFGRMMNTKSYKNFNKDFEEEDIYELNRLWIDDCLGMNAETILLGASWKIIRNNYPKIKAIQSFADGRLGCGTIYKASNFDYYGYTETLFYENIKTGEVQHNVPMENTSSYKNFVRLNAMFARGEFRPFYVKTYMYVYPLYKNVKIELKKETYPKYDKGIIYDDNYTHRDGLYFRAFILSYLLNDKNFHDLQSFILKKYDQQTIYAEMKKSFENESILEFVKDKNKQNKFNELIKNKIQDLIVEIDEQTSIFDFIEDEIEEEYDWQV